MKGNYINISIPSLSKSGPSNFIAQKMSSNSGILCGKKYFESRNLSIRPIFIRSQHNFGWKDDESLVIKKNYFINVTDNCSQDALFCLC